jgi:hypothetical protein
MLPRNTMAAAVAERTSAVAERTSVVAERTSVVAERTSVVAERASVVAEHTSAVETLGLVVASRPGVGRAHQPWLGADPGEVCTWRRDLGPVLSSPVDTVAISGTAVGGTTALARAGYGQTIMASTYGPAIRVLRLHFRSPAAHPPASGICMFDFLFRLVGNRLFFGLWTRIDQTVEGAD